jgi:predicted RNase H-like nuclease (RuvC/YqgF family)
MSQEEKLDKLQEQVDALSSQVHKAKTIIVIGGPILAGVITAFFGISYNKIGEQTDAAVQKYIDGIAFERTVAELKTKAEEANSQIESIKRSTQEQIDHLNSQLEKRNRELVNQIPGIHELMSKLSNYESTAKKFVASIEEYDRVAASLVPSLQKLSTYGTAKHGEVISVPEGTAKQWSIIVSPKYIGADQSDSGGNLTPLLSADYGVRLISPTEWQVSALSRYKFGAAVKTYEGMVNYIIILNSLVSENRLTKP